jgi:hypothetical protein
VRARSGGAEIVAATRRSVAWLPALSGRRVLPFDDAAMAFTQARRAGLRFVVVDDPAVPEPAGTLEVFHQPSVSAYRLAP